MTRRRSRLAPVDLGNLRSPHFGVISGKPTTYGVRVMRGIRGRGPPRFIYLRHLSAFRIDRDGNSLPVAEKSTGMAENAATELKYILFWDNPMIGSVSRADGSPRAQTRQIGPFRRANSLLRVDDQGAQSRRPDAARARQASTSAAIFCCQI